MSRCTLIGMRGSIFSLGNLLYVQMAVVSACLIINFFKLSRVIYKHICLYITRVSIGIGK